MRDRNFYQVLGVARTASQTEIRAAYARLVRRHHPDVAGALPDRLRDVQQAYRALSRTDARAEHDLAIIAAERLHADRRARVQRRLRGYDRRHPRPVPRPSPKWTVVLFAAAAIVAGLSFRLLG